MKDCKSVLDSLFNYIDNEMSPKDAGEMKAHLDLCRGCFDRIEFEKNLRAHFKDKTNHCCPEKVKDKIKKIIESF